MWTQLGQALESALLGDLDFDGDPALASLDARDDSDGLAPEAEQLGRAGRSLHRRGPAPTRQAREEVTPAGSECAAWWREFL